MKCWIVCVPVFLLAMTIALLADGGRANAQIPPQVDLDKMVNECVLIENYYSAKRPALVATYLGHESMVLRTQAVSCLVGLGLPNNLVGPYQKAEKTGDAAKVAEALAPIRAWAQTAPSSSDPIKDTTSRERAVDWVLDGWVSLVKDRNLPGEFAHSLIRSFPSFVPKLRSDEEKISAFIFPTEILSFEDLRTEIGLNTNAATKENAIQWLPMLQQWMSANHPYLYYHPKEHRMKLDVAARTAGIGSNDYRVTHPWGADEGPNHIDPQRQRFPDDDE